VSKKWKGGKKKRGASKPLNTDTTSPVAVVQGKTSRLEDEVGNKAPVAAPAVETATAVIEEPQPESVDEPLFSSYRARIRTCCRASPESVVESQPELVVESHSEPVVDS
jgi:hypothetical protein